MSWQTELAPELQTKIQAVDAQIAPRLTALDDQIINNQAKVLQAFQDQSISETHLNGTTGYGNDDQGRDKLEAVYSQVFGTEDALVRPQLVSGTHAIGTALLGMLRPGDDLLYLTGEPYDTLQEVIGIAGNGIGSLKEYQIGFDYVPLLADGSVDFELAKTMITAKTKVIAIQRSRGYAVRDSFTVAKIAEMVRFIKTVNPDSIIFVDNAYGEFSEVIEPTDVGVDVMAGSLIKNAGGGIAQTGGYIVGTQRLIEMIGYRLTVPGVGASEGATQGNLQLMFEGFFLAPSVTGNAIKGAIYEAALLEKMGLSVSPKWDAPRTDLIQTVNFGNPDDMVKFAGCVQAQSPIDSFVTPIPSDFAGYEDQIVMAAGTFIQGASIEFSADGPIRAPYTLYLQGGLTYAHIKLAISRAVQTTYYA
ncbi:methionine gamma-lyase family protein [Latilactobacillus fuchuensis]|uniref:C-S lyase n=1 Tax=Latilactobacillus fuchuensis TaxID=164393 RepID=A0A2N9DWG9_9LACO|nr:methionine gamma-lyase family protein [Latilactobacillus fuchuensis]SPC39029.1 putative C-S lyase [Latilactobacillus fuchuensis]